MSACVSEHLGFFTWTFFLMTRVLISLEPLATGWCFHECFPLLPSDGQHHFLLFSQITQVVLFTREDAVVCDVRLNDLSVMYTAC